LKRPLIGTVASVPTAANISAFARCPNEDAALNVHVASAADDDSAVAVVSLPLVLLEL